MDTKHTPGPWTVREGDGNYLWEVAGKTPRGKDRVICRPAGSDRQANARLIAAAPDLLAALHEQVLVNRMLMHDAGLDEQAILDGTAQARAAILKATGEPK
jgi:hypothetical protein